MSDIKNITEEPIKSKFIETKKFKDWFWDLFSNPDGSGSTKNTAGWLLIIAAVTTGFILLFKVNINETLAITVFSSFLLYGLASFGLNVMGNKDYFKYIESALKNKKTEERNEDKGHDGKDDSSNKMLLS